MSPDGTDYGVESFAFQPGKGHSEVLAVDHETHGAFVHVEDDAERIGHDEVFVVVGRRLQFSHLEFFPTVEEDVSSDVPAPRIGVATHEALVTLAVKRGVFRADPHDGMGAPLPQFPDDLPHVNAGLVTDLAPDGVRALGDRMSVDREAIIFFDENV